MKCGSMQGGGSMRRRGRHVAVRLLTAIGALAATSNAAAQALPPLQLQLDSLYQLPQRGVRLPSAHQSAADTVAATSDPPAPAEGRRSEPAYGASAARTTLLEMPADVVPGRYTRPKYALGFRSDTMKGFARDMGLDADTCLAPLVRARVSLSQDSVTGGRLMVFARCTFN